MQLSTIIVSFNTKDLLRQTLQSLPQKKDWETIVIDNNSKDGSAEMVRRDFPKVRLLKNRENLGFARANNQGLKVAGGNYLLLLNSDTLVKKNALEYLIRFMERNPQIGIASGQLLNPDGTIQPQGGHLPRLTNIAFWMLFLDDLPLIGKFLWPYHVNDRTFFLKARRTGWVGGTAMMLKKSVIDAIGYLNEDIFMYAEDVEYCLRAKKAGFAVAVIPEAKIVHYGQQSSGGAPTAAWLGEYKGIKYIFRKHKPGWEYPLVRLLLRLGALLRILVFGILLGRRTAYEAYKKAFAMA